MSKIKTTHIFTSEAVSEGHPDKVCDQISDAIVDACLMQDPQSHVACECLATTNFLVIAGEITTNAVVDYEGIARGVIRKIGYTDPTLGFNADDCEIVVRIHQQSSDIAQGVNRATEIEQGAGDQGMMFGYASRGTESMLPAPIHYAHSILNRLVELRRSGNYPYLRPDAKSQVSIAYEDGVAKELVAVVVSHQHSPDMKIEQLEALVRQVVREVFPAELLTGNEEYYINPTGKFEIGGPNGDCGVTGRKIIVDTYGGVGSHGGGAFSGKDPSKVDRSAAYMGRYCAKNIVAAGFADKCEIQVAYAIGVAKPVSINVDTYGTGCCPEIENILQDILLKGEVFDFRPAMIIKNLGLTHPTKDGWNYQTTAEAGHFMNPTFPWEQTDRIEELKKAVAQHIANQ